MARKILLADDSVTAQNMGRKILADAGYEVITVNNGSAALKKIADARPDLIVLDVYMPGYSGLEVCQRLKESGDTARIPILLTVGKLEPFKPEEAKRVRAEGFIVKPFEASELLSALAKLEDKIVPRSDSSKPGRFARAIAAVEEGRYDNTVAIDEDSGWKNRIAFPSRKKSKTADAEDGNDPAIYNPVNKDLKTVVEHQRVAPPVMVPANGEEHVDLGALAPEGLPKDVTAEEIAALAAAAAQVKGITASNGTEQPASTPATLVSDTKIESGTKGQEQTEKTETAHPKVESAVPSPAAEQKSETPQISESTQSVTGSAGSSVPVGEGATFAAQKSQDEQTETTSQPVPAETHGALEPANVAAESPAPSPTSSEFPSHEAPRHFEPEPVTMAHAAMVPQRSSRWTAVATALAPEEVGIVLEEEMRKVYAAFVGADSRASEPSVPSSDPEQSASASIMESASVVSGSPAEPVASVAVVETSSLPEVVHPVTETPVSAPEPVGAQVREFEAIPAHSFEPPPPAFSESAEPPAMEQSAMPPVVEEVAPSPLNISEPSEQQATTPVPEALISPVETAGSVVVDAEKITEPHAESQNIEAQQEESAAVLSVSEVRETPEVAEELQARETLAEVAGEPPTANQASLESTDTSAPAQATRGGTGDIAKKESDMAATTAAAWASWRRIRESGDSSTGSALSSSSAKNEPADKAPNEEAAMAVAAGAERPPEEASESSEESPEIATIVDTVLADLRPKIVEEISRKLGRKNKKK